MNEDVETNEAVNEDEHMDAVHQVLKRYVLLQYDVSLS